MDDPEDKKPEGWDDIPAQIADPEAKKPEDWVRATCIADGNDGRRVDEGVGWNGRLTSMYLCLHRTTRRTGSGWRP